MQPAAGDAGLSVGAAFAVHHRLGGARKFTMEHAYWGPRFSASYIRRIVDSALPPGEADISELDETTLVESAARHIADGKIVGWFQGAAEWGPRALGNRSRLLADPRRPEMKVTH